MTFELDHVFLATAMPEADEATLTNFGFQLTQRKVHRGQGTSNACAIFENAFFELLYAHDMEELRSELVQPLGLAERIHWQETGACPIGICFRPACDNKPSEPLPFATWKYKAEYLPPNVTIPIVTPRASFTEPLLFLSNQPRKPAPQDSNRERSHEPSLRTLTGVTVRRPTGASSCSSGVRWFENNGLISLQDDTEYLLELEFNNGSEDQGHRFSASLPLVVYW